MEELTLKDEFIKLGQALKACGLAESGAEAKQVILDQPEYTFRHPLGDMRKEGNVC